jgi:circadian clock protein KaiC
MERIGSGIPQLDDLLGGGFPARAIHLVMGPPGSGKTILVEQVAFAAPSTDRPVLYVTTLSEPASKFITFLQEHTFANAELIGERLIYENIAEEAAASPERIHEQILRLIQEHRPSIVIIDSFKALSDLQSSMATWRRVLYELAGLLSAFDTTTFWVGEYSADMVSKLPEFAVADGIVELTRAQHGTSDERRFRVVKLRGSGFRDGYHCFRITPGGLEIFPRLVSPTVVHSYHPAAERLKSGILGLDEMIEQGWLRGSSTLVAGPSGSGKTMLGLHFLHEGVRGGEATLLVTFQENPTQLARIMKSIGWDPDELLAPGRLEVLLRCSREGTRLCSPKGTHLGAQLA